MRQSLFPCLLIAGLSCHTCLAKDWADAAGSDKDFAQSKAICLKARTVVLPKVDAGGKKDCDSSALLYGIARKADPQAARACAYAETAKGADTPPTGGYATLTTIYANGWSVARNYDVAIAFACRLDGAPAENDGWVKHLARLRKDGPGAKPFDICDDVTSGLMEGFCAERQGDLADAKRAGEIVGLTSSLTGSAETAFSKLQLAEKAFVQSSADNEVDTSGTGRGAFIVESKLTHEDMFLAMLRDLLADHLPAASLGFADQSLNKAYQTLMATKDTSSLGTVEKKGIKATQQSWLRYRDAFAAFAKAAKPGDTVDRLLARLTEARTKELEQLTPD